MSFPYMELRSSALSINPRTGSEITGNYFYFSTEFQTSFLQTLPELACILYLRPAALWTHSLIPLIPCLILNDMSSSTVFTHIFLTFDLRDTLLKFQNIFWLLVLMNQFLSLSTFVSALLWFLLDWILYKPWKHYFLIWFSMYSTVILLFFSLRACTKTVKIHELSNIFNTCNNN